MGVLLFKGGVGVGMLKWQTSEGAGTAPVPTSSRGAVAAPCEKGLPNTLPNNFSNTLSHPLALPHKPVV
jgi:hypothetical protein